MKGLSGEDKKRMRETIDRRISEPTAELEERYKVMVKGDYKGRRLGVLFHWTLRVSGSRALRRPSLKAWKDDKELLIR